MGTATVHPAVGEVVVLRDGWANAAGFTDPVMFDAVIVSDSADCVHCSSKPRTDRNPVPTCARCAADRFDLKHAHDGWLYEAPSCLVCQSAASGI